jgi:hypothetical protein
MLKFTSIIIIVIAIIALINAQCSGCGCCGGCSSCACVACYSSSGSSCNCQDNQLSAITDKQCAKCLFVFSIYDTMNKVSDYDMLRSFYQSINSTYEITANVDMCLYLDMCSQKDLDTYQFVGKYIVSNPYPTN